MNPFSQKPYLPLSSSWTPHASLQGLPPRKHPQWRKLHHCHSPGPPVPSFGLPVFEIQVLGLIEIVKGLGAKNVLTETF